MHIRQAGLRAGLSLALFLSVPLLGHVARAGQIELLEGMDGGAVYRLVMPQEAARVPSQALSLFYVDAGACLRTIAGKVTLGVNLYRGLRDRGLSEHQAHETLLRWHMVPDAVADFSIHVPNDMEPRKAESIVMAYCLHDAADHASR